MEAAGEKHRKHGTPDACFGCRHAYYDMEEGWNCRRYDAIVVLSDGRTLGWHGQACDAAMETCKGDGFARALFPAFMRRYPIPSILVGCAMFAFVAVKLTFHA